MKRHRSAVATLVIAGVIGAGLITLGDARASVAICCPFPCGDPDCWIRSIGQLNLVVIDRAAGRVRLVPNIRFSGQSPVFALVVPTPSLPSLEPADKAIWTEASLLTAPLRAIRSGSGSLSCDSRDDAIPLGAGETTLAGDVVVHARETVGAFEATIVSSSSSTALVDWLNDNGFTISQADADRFEPYVARGWFFTAMKMDTTDAANQMPVNGWDAQVNPVIFDYAATEFEIPLPVLTINMGTSLPIVVYVVDDSRAAIAGFATDYANRISESEYAAIRERQPTLAPFLASGRFLTRLARTFTDPSTMGASVTTERATTDDEFRRISRAPVTRGSEGEDGQRVSQGRVLDLFLVALAVAAPRAWSRRNEAKSRFVRRIG